MSGEVMDYLLSLGFWVWVFVTVMLAALWRFEASFRRYHEAEAKRYREMWGRAVGVSDPHDHDAW